MWTMLSGMDIRVASYLRCSIRNGRTGQSLLFFRDSVRLTLEIACTKAHFTGDVYDYPSCLMPQSIDVVRPIRICLFIS